MTDARHLKFVSTHPVNPELRMRRGMMSSLFRVPDYMSPPPMWRPPGHDMDVRNWGELGPIPPPLIVERQLVPRVVERVIACAAARGVSLTRVPPRPMPCQLQVLRCKAPQVAFVVVGDLWSAYDGASSILTRRWRLWREHVLGNRKMVLKLMSWFGTKRVRARVITPAMMVWPDLLEAAVESVTNPTYKNQLRCAELEYERRMHPHVSRFKWRLPPDLLDALFQARAWREYYRAEIAYYHRRQENARNALAYRMRRFRALQRWG